MTSSSEDEIFNQRRHRPKKSEKQLEDLFEDDMSYEEEIYSDVDDFEAGRLKGIFLEIFGDGTEYSYSKKEVKNDLKGDFEGEINNESESDYELDMYDDEMDVYDNDHLLDEIDDLTDFIQKNMSYDINSLKEIIILLTKNYSPDYITCHHPGNYDFFIVREIKELMKKYQKFKSFKEKAAKILRIDDKMPSNCRSSFIHRIHTLDEMYNFYLYIKKTEGDKYAFCPDFTDSTENDKANDKNFNHLKKIVNLPILPVDQFMENLFFSHKIFSPSDEDQDVDENKMITFLSMNPFFKAKVKKIFIIEGVYKTQNLKVSEVYDFLNSNLNKNSQILTDFSGKIKIKDIIVDLNMKPELEISQKAIQDNFLNFYTTTKDDDKSNSLNIKREKIINEAIKKIDIEELIKNEIYNLFKKIAQRQMSISVIDRIMNGAIKPSSTVFIVTEDSKMRILVTDQLLRTKEYVSINRFLINEISILVDKYKPSHIAIVGDSVSMKYTFFKFRDNFSDEGITILYVDDFNSIGNNYYHNNYSLRGNVENFNNNFNNNSKQFSITSIKTFSSTEEFLYSIATRLISPEIYFSNLIKSQISGFLEINSTEIHQSIEDAILISLAILGIDINFLFKVENGLFEIVPGLRNLKNPRKIVKKLKIVSKIEELRNFFKTEVDFNNAVVYLRIFSHHPIYHEADKNTNHDNFNNSIDNFNNTIDNFNNKIDNNSVNNNSVNKNLNFDILDSTIVHPNNYHIARIICAAALDKEEVDDTNPSLCVEEVLKNKNLLKDFVVPEDNPKTNEHFLVLNQLFFEERRIYNGVNDEHLFLIANFSIFINFLNSYHSSLYGFTKNKSNDLKNDQKNDLKNDYKDDLKDDKSNDYKDDNDLIMLVEKVDNILKTPAIFLNYKHLIDIFNELLNKAFFEATVHKKLNNCMLLFIGKSNVFVKTNFELYPNELVFVVLKEIIYHSLSFSGEILRRKNKIFRFIKHPLFKNFNSKEAEEYLVSENKLIVLRLSRSGEYGVFTVKIENIFVHFRVDEIYAQGKDYYNILGISKIDDNYGSNSGVIYVLNSKNYDSIDSILDEYFYPYMKVIENLKSSPLYKSYGKISTEFSEKYPGYLQIRYKDYIEFLKICEQGVVYNDKISGNMVFSCVEDYIQFRVNASKRQVR
ncbi:Transcription elongation factor SPT6 [Dictyocoela muelleri]|nr:Transcription elongation factor SPT6 [Dictyocoela muelleri]